MNNQESSNAKFSISNWKLFQESINPTKIRKFSIGLSSKKAVENMTIRIVNRDNINDNFFSIDAPYSESTVRKGVKEKYISQTVLHGILCLFFHEFQKDSKYDIEYKKEHIQSLLKAIKLVEDEKGSIKRFRDFFAQLVIPKRFGDKFEIIIDENWEFSIAEDIEDEYPSENLEDIVNDFKEDQKAIEPNFDSDSELNNPVLKVGLKKSGVVKQKTKRSFIYKWRYLITGLVILSAIIFGSIKVYNYILEQNRIEKERMDNQKKIEDKKNIIENASSEKISRTQKLVSIYDAIERELNTDYKKDGIRNLSSGLIGRIITLSEALEPYLYLKKGKVIDSKLSPERADLFLTLFRNNLDIDVFNNIITKANFTYSDFSNKDLSSLDLSKGVYGIKGGFNNEIQLFIAPIGKVDFSYSSFRNTNLDNTILYGRFSNSDFRDCFSNSLQMIWSSCYNCNFQETEFKNCRFEKTSFNHSNFKNSSLGIGKGYGRGFLYCDLRGVIFDGSTISGGMEEFQFQNCFFSSEGTFFEYSFNTEWFNKIFLMANPFIDGNDNYPPMDSYEILNYSDSYITNKSTLIANDSISKFSRFISNKFRETGNIVLKEGFNIFNEPYYDEYKMWSSFSSGWYWTMVRINDNVNRNHKVIRNFTSFYGVNWDSYKSKWDTMYRRSSFNRLQSEYRGVIYEHKKRKDSLQDGIASFKNCKFIYTHFINSNMEYVNFHNSIFEKYTENIGNRFINIKFKGNDFRIKSGTFIFSSKTSYDNLLINLHFPLLK